MFAHNNSLRPPLLLLLLLLLLVLLSRDYSSRVLWPVCGRRGPAAARRGNYRWYHSWRITIISITSGQDMKGQPSHSHSIHVAIFNIELIGHHTSHLKALLSQYLITRFNNRPRRTAWCRVGDGSAD